jgi:predicted aspartyl protease
VPGQPRSVTLIGSGATVPVIVRSGYGQEQTVTALIDTGSHYSLIDVGLIGQLQPQWIDQWQVGGAGSSPIIADVYQVEIEIPHLHIREFTATIAALYGRKHQFILGRQQLRTCTLIYDGPKGTASLSR